MLRSVHKSHRSYGSGEIRLDQVSPQRQRLVRLLQKLGFGSIHSLRIKGGDPILDPPPRLVRVRKPGIPNSRHPGTTISTFVLKREWIELFKDMDAIADGTIHRIDAMHGLPVLYEFEDVISI